ncbi:MAG: WG repeat-containing protein [Ignavibacteriaceae bacterium]|nr:WG repeat-containing protein [Ignavibacteriaceae bacterium]
MSKGRLVAGLQFPNGLHKWLPYVWVDNFHNDRAVVDDGENMGYMDRQGNICIPLIYFVAEDFSEGLAFANDGDRTFLLDTEGKTIRQWDEVFITSRFRNGTALISRLVEDGEKAEEALINTKGEFITPFAPKRQLHDIADAFTDIETEDDQWHEGIQRIITED